MRIVISSGHGKYVQGASGYLNEVDEARRVVEHVADYLGDAGVSVDVFHDDVSNDVDENLNRIVDFHNNQARDLDVSVHFNAFETTHEPRGTETWYASDSGKAWAKKVSPPLAAAGHFTDRGPKHTTGLFFLNHTEETAILIEVCFVDSSADATLYGEHFDAICRAISEALSGEEAKETTPTIQPPEEWMFHTSGRCSHFGGPEDTGVTLDEGLAFIYEYDDAPHLFLPTQPEGTTGLARRLNPGIFYVACRWDYEITPKTALLDPSYQAIVRANGKEFLAWPADWGPNENTGRVADLSPGLMEALGLNTDDEVEVIYPNA